MYCPKCGKNLNDKANFCSSCGYKLSQEPQDEAEKTKEINLEILKEVEQKPNYSFNTKSPKNNNYIVIALFIILILLLVIILLVISNRQKSHINVEPKQSFCSENYDPDLCGIEDADNEVTKEFDSLDFTAYDFSTTSSKTAFYDSVITILKEKQKEGTTYCNNASYTNATNNLNNVLNSEYSYLCGMDLTYLNQLVTRLEQFYKQNNLNDKVVDAYVVGRGGRNEYANYTGATIGSNSTYIAYIRRVHMNINMFKDYDKLTKSYERDLEGGFHPKNSYPEDIVVHETAHAIDFYITASRYGIESIVIDDFQKYNQLFSTWGNQTYAKEVVQQAAKNVNSNYTSIGKATKTELELRQEISGYAASTKDGTIMYAETFAEALVDYLSNGNNASDLSIEIYKIVQQDLANL